MADALVLGIDTATRVQVGLADRTRVLASRSYDDPMRHVEQLAPVIAEALSDTGVRMDQLTGIAVGVGPGPYTGLRVGIATARVLGSVLGIPVRGICTLDVLAAQWVRGEQPPTRDFLIATDARRREVYWATYVDGTRARGPEVAAPADVPTADLDETTGAGAELYTDVLGLPYDGGRYPSGLTLVSRAIDRIRAAAPSDPLTPLYLRRPDAVPPGAPKPVTA
jgi:tRNA threonylcarbamoyl adenosine modification protein YeaZ